MRRRAGAHRVKFILASTIIALIGVAVFYIFTSKTFERNRPQITLANTTHWNLRTPLMVEVKDDSGIKAIKITLSENDREIPLMNEKFELIKNELGLQINFPKGLIYNKDAKYSLAIEASDVSKWNFLLGNTQTAESVIIVDQKKPEVYAINQSYKISKGGSALVIFSAKDESLSELYIGTNFGKKFIATPYLKDGYYAALVAWPANLDDFAAYIVAKDLAGNETKIKTQFFIQNRSYKSSTIALKKSFIDGKISELAEQYSQNSSALSDIEKFKFVNETLRNANEQAINTESSKVPEALINGFFIKPFYPLKNGQAVASFGDHRFYTQDEKHVSESWHLGLDLASTANAQIIQSNPGKVVLVKENGIYGLNAMVYHGFGLYTLYGHCSKIDVEVGDEIKAGQILGYTGSSGLAFGDHLHFGTIVQGIEVRPEEWMDAKWMKENIYNILDSAKKVIENKR